MKSLRFFFTFKRWFSRKARTEVFFFGVSLLLPALVLLFVFIYPSVSIAVLRSLSNSPVPQMEIIIATELDQLSQSARALANSPTVQRYVKERAAYELIDVVIDETQEKGIGNIIFTDDRGLTLAQSTLALRRGDHVPRMTRWGAEVARTGSTEMVSFCPVSPLLIVSGQSILSNNDSVVGSVFALQYLNDAYARHLRDTYLPLESELAFVRNLDGVTGASFDDSATRLLFFNALESTQATHTYLPSLISVQDDNYFVYRTPLFEREKEIGRAVILVKAFHATVAILLASVITLLFFLVHTGIHRLRHGFFSDKHRVAIVLCSLFIFAASFLVVRFFLGRSATKVTTLSSPIYNSTLHLEPEFGTVRQDRELRVAVKIRTGGENINAAEATLSFNPSRFEVLEISFEHSFCSPEFTLEKSIDNVTGVVHVACIVLDSVLADTEANLAELIIAPRATGPVSLRFTEETRVIADDGLGTNVLRKKTDGFYQIVETGIQDNTLQLVSLSHPNSERWYSRKEIEMYWNFRAPLRYLLSSKDGIVVPEDALEVTSSSVTISAPDDGEYYFSVVASGGEQASYRLRIDTTPPEPPIIRVSNPRPESGELVRFEFTGHDKASGLQSTFYVRLDQGTFLPVGSSLSVPFSLRGVHEVVVRAFDNANNFSDSVVYVTVQ